MFDATTVRPLRRRTLRKAPPLTTPCLAAGTIVLTMDGALPVETLAPGDRIITRAGARVLRLIRQDGSGDMQGFRLGFDGAEVIYANGTEVCTAPTA